MAKFNKEQLEQYWIKRNELLFTEGEKDIYKVLEDLQKNYERCIKQIENEINMFYGRYAANNKLTLTEAKKLLNTDELKDFKTYLHEIVELCKDNKLRNSYINELETLKARAKISRLSELQTKIRYQIESLEHLTETTLDTTFSNTYNEAYYKTIFNAQQLVNFSPSFLELNVEAITKAISTKYMEVNYSSALWKNKNNLLTILESEIPRGITLGYNPRKVASLASKKLNTNYNSTVRLVRTEYNLILNDGASKGYKEAGIERYQLLATLDNRTSEICQDMDGKIFEVSKKAVGINYPPFHPNCRTTTIAYFEPDEFDEYSTRIARDNEGNIYKVPGNLTYKKWKEGLKLQDDGTLRYEGGEK